MIPTRNSLLPARQYARRQGREIVGEGEEILNYWCPLKIFGDFRDFYFLGQPIYWTHK